MVDAEKEKLTPGQWVLVSFVLLVLFGIPAGAMLADVIFGEGWQFPAWAANLFTWLSWALVGLGGIICVFLLSLGVYVLILFLAPDVVKSKDENVSTPKYLIFKAFWIMCAVTVGTICGTIAAAVAITGWHVLFYEPSHGYVWKSTGTAVSIFMYPLVVILALGIMAGIGVFVPRLLINRAVKAGHREILWVTAATLISSFIGVLALLSEQLWHWLSY